MSNSIKLTTDDNVIETKFLDALADSTEFALLAVRDMDEIKQYGEETTIVEANEIQTPMTSLHTHNVIGLTTMYDNTMANSPRFIKDALIVMPADKVADLKEKLKVALMLMGINGKEDSIVALENVINTHKNAIYQTSHNLSTRFLVADSDDVIDFGWVAGIQLVMLNYPTGPNINVSVRFNIECEYTYEIFYAEVFMSLRNLVKAIF